MTKFEQYKQRHATEKLEWDSWEHASFQLAHALSDILVHGWVSKKYYELYVAGIHWANSFHSHEVATIPTWSDCKENAVQGRKVCHKNNDIDCMSQDIFTAIFSVSLMTSGMFQLETSDYKLLDPLKLHLQKLVPWFRWKE